MSSTDDELRGLIKQANATIGGTVMGTYTGDGTADWSKQIECGFRPKAVIIYEDVAVDGAIDCFIYIDDGNKRTFTSTTAGGSEAVDNRIRTFATGFEVQDDGADLHPNKNGDDYVYIVIAGGVLNTTASNQGGGGVGLYHSKVADDLQFKNINAGSAMITITNDAGNKEVDIDIDLGEIDLDELNTHDHDLLDGLGDDDHTQYLLCDATRNITENFMFDKHVGISVAASVAHLLLLTETFTGNDISMVGIGNFPTIAPAIAGDTDGYAIQGNIWFDTVNWNAGSTITALMFFPAPSADGVGSANLDLAGIITGGLINVGARTVVAGTIAGITVSPFSSIFGAGGDVTADLVYGIKIPSCIATDGAFARLVGLQIDPQVEGVINQGLWMAGDGIGSDIVLGEGMDATLYYDGTNVVLNPQLVGAGGLEILSMKSGANQGAAGALANELWKTNGHVHLEDNVVMIGV